MISFDPTSLPYVLCVGAATWDIILKVDGLPARPGKVIATDRVECAAGMATSAAIAISRLGARASVWARIGTDATGDRWLADVRGREVHTGWVERVPGARTALGAIIVGDDGDCLVCPHYDPALRSRVPTELPRPVRGFHAVLTDTRWPEAAALALGEARRAGLPAVLDADVAPREAIAALLPQCTHPVFSAAALEAFSGKTDPEAGLRAVRAAHHVCAAVTLGAEGCLVLTDRVTRIAAYPVRAVDTLAAGDVFHGAFTLAVGAGNPPEAAARFANVAAALKCTRFGGNRGAPTRAEVLSCLEPEDAPT